MTSDHQPRELIDCAAGDYLMRAALFRGSNLDLARVIGLFDSAVRISRAKPLLGRPAVEGIATLPRQNRSNNDLHGGSFQQLSHLPFGRSITLYRSSARSPNKCVNWLTLPAISLRRRSSMSYFLKGPTSESSTEISPEKLISFES